MKIWRVRNGGENISGRGWHSAHFSHLQSPEGARSSMRIVAAPFGSVSLKNLKRRAAMTALTQLTHGNYTDRPRENFL